MSFFKTYAIDASVGLIKRDKSLAALTATGFVGTQFDQLNAAATDMVCVVNLESIVINGVTAETYKLTVVGSNLANRSDGEILDQTTIGAAATVGAPETRNAAAGDRLLMGFRTEKNRTKYRYVDLHLTVTGTAPSIAFNAYFSKEVV